MLVKILGGVDLAISLVLLLLCLRVEIPNMILIISVVILLVKGISIFTLDLASFFDVYAAILLILSIFFNVPVVLLGIAFFLVLQKGIFSLL